jgi:hypothetical protein
VDSLKRAAFYRCRLTNTRRTTSAATLSNSHARGLDVVGVYEERVSTAKRRVEYERKILEVRRIRHCARLLAHVIALAA